VDGTETQTHKMTDLKTTIEERLKNIDPKVLEGINETFHLDIEGSGQFTLSVVNGDAQVLTGLVGDPGCTVKSSIKTLEDLSSGKLNPATALFMGKIKISNLSLLMKYGKLLGIG
jgi:putative sterol carrier protein